MGLGSVSHFCSARTKGESHWSRTYWVMSEYDWVQQELLICCFSFKENGVRQYKYGQKRKWSSVVVRRLNRMEGNRPANECKSLCPDELYSTVIIHMFLTLLASGCQKELGLPEYYGPIPLWLIFWKLTHCKIGPTVWVSSGNASDQCLNISVHLSCFSLLILLPCYCLAC